MLKRYKAKNICNFLSWRWNLSPASPQLSVWAELSDQLPKTVKDYGKEKTATLQKRNLTTTTYLSKWWRLVSPVTGHMDIMYPRQDRKRRAIQLCGSPFQNSQPLSKYEKNIRKSQTEGQSTKYLKNTLLKLSRSWKTRKHWETVADGD